MSDSSNSPNPQNHFDPVKEDEPGVAIDDPSPASSSHIQTSSETTVEFINGESDTAKLPQPSTTAITANSKDTSEALAKGISSLLGSVIRDFDSKAEDVSRSQDQLCSAIDRLTRELDKLLEDAPLPFIMQHAAKITGIRKRVLSLNTLLKSIQRRLDNVDRMLSAGLSHEKPSVEGSRKS
ncbi:hypothetical protein Ancab_025804 [Ancistrocladus abbreviatus]